MESEFKTFEDYVKYCKDKDKWIIQKLIHVPDINYMIDHLSTMADKTFIYNEEEHKCYFYINDKLYKLSVTFEEVEV